MNARFHAPLLAALLLLAPASASAQATIQIVNFDFPGIGFNDPTPAAPVGGNTGATVGEQRIIAFQHAAGIWGQTLTSTITIRIAAFFDDTMACTATSAALGGAAPYRSVRDFAPDPGFPGLEPGTWYPIALGEKRTGFPISEVFAPADPFQAVAIFNPDLGSTGCLENSGWYYGLDTNTPAGRINMVTVLLHEFAHGLGFTVNPTSASTGNRSGGFPSIWESRMRDLSLNKTWLAMTSAERMSSATNTANLVWQGAAMAAAVPSVLGPGTELLIRGKKSIEGAYQVEPAAGTTLSGELKGVVTRGRDLGGASEFDACEPIINDVAGRIALADRGTCTFLVKAQNAQAAGAIGLVIANDRPGLLAPGAMDSTITIPVVGISQADGDTIRSVGPMTGDGDGGQPATLRASTTFRAGTTAGWPRLYAPPAFQQGSSVSHFDTSLTPNVLMEPFLTRTLTHEVIPPFDLTFRLLQDIGW